MQLGVLALPPIPSKGKMKKVFIGEGALAMPQTPMRVKTKTAFKGTWCIGGVANNWQRENVNALCLDMGYCGAHIT